MRDLKLLRRISELEDKLGKLHDALPRPEFQVMTEEELKTLRDLSQKLVTIGGKVEDCPEIIEMWQTVWARLMRGLAGRRLMADWSFEEDFEKAIPSEVRSRLQR